MMAIEKESLVRKLDATGVPLLLARITLGGLFIWMGIGKLGHPIEFLKQIHLYHMLPEEPAFFLNATAIVLPWLELFCGVALILGLWVRGAAAMIALMLAVFTPAILLRALDVHHTVGTPFFQIEFDCGCGTGPVVIWWKLLTNSSLFLVTLIGVFSQSRRFCLSMWFARRSPVADFCHLCGYAVRQATAGLCEKCATPPVLEREVATPAG